MTQDKDLDDLIERKRRRTGERYPLISDADMNALIEIDPIFLEMERRLKAIEELTS